MKKAEIFSFSKNIWRWFFNMCKEKETPKVKFRKFDGVYLRPICREDLPTITAYMNDKSVTEYLSTSYPRSFESETKWLDGLSNCKTDIVLAIVLEKDDEFIGVIGLHKIDHVNGTARTGMWIGKKEHRGKGYGHIAKMMLLDYAFNTLNLRKVCSSTIAFNDRSQKCLMRCGYVKEGVRKDQYFRGGRYWDEILWAVFRSEDFNNLLEEFQAVNSIS